MALSSPHLDSVVHCVIYHLPIRLIVCLFCVFPLNTDILYLLIALSILFKSHPSGKGPLKIEQAKSLRFHFDRTTSQHRTTFMFTVLMCLSSVDRRQGVTCVISCFPHPLSIADFTLPLQALFAFASHIGPHLFHVFLISPLPRLTSP